MDIVSRLHEFMKYTGLPSTQFADRAGIPRPTLSQIINGRNKKISNEVFTKLHDAFPSLNMLWLMFGDGDMVSNSNIEISEPQIRTNTPQSTPHIPEQLTLGSADESYFDDRIDRQSVNERRVEPDDASDNHKSAPQNDTRGYPKPSDAMPAGFTPAVLAGLASKVSETAGDKSRRIQSIMVFYSDNSFETFYPSDGERNA